MSHSQSKTLKKQGSSWLASELEVCCCTALQLGFSITSQKPTGLQAVMECGEERIHHQQHLSVCCNKQFDGLVELGALCTTFPKTRVDWFPGSWMTKTCRPDWRYLKSSSKLEECKIFISQMFQLEDTRPKSSYLIMSKSPSSILSSSDSRSWNLFLYKVFPPAFVFTSHKLPPASKSRNMITWSVVHKIQAPGNMTPFSQIFTSARSSRNLGANHSL